MYQSTTYSASMMENQQIAARDLTPPPSETDLARERGAMQSGPPIIMQQPRSSFDSSSEANEQGGSFHDEEEGASGGIATVEGSAWSATNISRYVPLTGLDFLVAADYVYIQQTIELIDILSSVESENRFLVKARSGETLFVAAEQSSKMERQCCGSWRSFTIRLFDMNRQETLILTRPLAASLCCCPCYLQELNVYLSNGRQLGRIQQEWTLVIPEFIVQDSTGAEIYRLQGPNCCGCFMYAESDFKIMSRDGLVQVGTISHSWDDFLHSYTMGVTFPSNANTESKALLVAASFLLEYMFYQKAKSRSWLRFLRLRC